MPEKCCGSCERWTRISNDGFMGDCGLIGVAIIDGAGRQCRAYLERGRETVRLEGVAHLAQTGDATAHLRCATAPSGRASMILARVSVTVPIPDEPPTVEGVVSE